MHRSSGLAYLSCFFPLDDFQQSAYDLPYVALDLSLSLPSHGALCSDRLLHLQPAQTWQCLLPVAFASPGVISR